MTKIDARGKHSPLPIVLAKRALRGMQSGQEMVVLATDRIFPRVLEVWCARAGHELLECGYANGHYLARVRVG